MYGVVLNIGLTNLVGPPALRELASYSLDKNIDCRGHQ